MKNFTTKYCDISLPVFLPAALITLIFIGLTLIYDQQAEQIFSSFQSFMSASFGWLINVSINYYLIFVLFLGFSKLGRIKIGGQDAEPDFKKFSWVAMLFSAGMGIGLVYFSVAEPMLNFNNPIEASITDLQKSKLAMRNTFFHYGFHVWGIYILLGTALAYFTFNKNYSLSLRSTLYPLFGKRLDGWLGHAIDVLAVLATLFGLATSLGFGAKQFSTGLSIYFDLGNSIDLQVLSIIGITLIATVSVLSGLARGLKYLSNLNMILALLVFVFVLVIGSTASLINGFLESLGNYFIGLADLSYFGSQYSEGGSWLKDWSMFYWVWWISWSPFVGTFIARISKGRTIREIVIYALLVPSLFSMLWMAVLGGSALELQLGGVVDLAQVVSNDSSMGLFKMLEQMPFYEITALLCIVLVATFFITSSDSGSLVVDYMTSGGKLDAPRGQKVFWACMEGAIAIALLVGGGLTALQSASISTGFPFAIILILVSISLYRSLKQDYKKQSEKKNRRRYSLM